MVGLPRKNDDFHGFSIVMLVYHIPTSHFLTPWETPLVKSLESFTG
jgi:hypothetical protein